MVGYVFDEEVSEDTEKESEGPRDWIFRDPLRGFSLDKFPYWRQEGELKLDFIFKSALYGPFFVLSFLDGGFFLFLFVPIWLGINFLRRKG